MLALERSNPGAPIVLWVDCPGGEVYSGFAIYDTARFISPRDGHRGRRLRREHRLGHCPGGGEGGPRGLPNAKLLIHQPLVGGVIHGSASDLEIHAKDIIELKKKMHRLYAERHGTPLERFVDLVERDR